MERWFRAGPRERRRVEALLAEALGTEEAREETIEMAQRWEDGWEPFLDQALSRYCALRGAGSESEEEDDDGRNDEEGEKDDDDARSETSVESGDDGETPPCPTCAAPLAYVAKQTRSADEGMTGFLVCARCGYSRRE